MTDINDMFKPGDVVIAEWKPNPLLERSEYMRQLDNPEPMPVDLSWTNPSYCHPDYTRADTYVHIGDRLTIVSKAINPPDGCRSYLFKVRDKNGNEFYCSCEWFREALSTDLLTSVDSTEFVALGKPV